MLCVWVTGGRFFFFFLDVILLVDVNCFLAKFVFTQRLLRLHLQRYSVTRGCVYLLANPPSKLRELTQILLLLFLPFSHQEEGRRPRKCGGQVQPVEAPQGSAEHGAGPPDGPVALRRRRPRPPGQAVRPSAQRGLPAGQELLHRWVPSSKSRVVDGLSFRFGGEVRSWVARLQMGTAEMGN